MEFSREVSEVMGEAFACAVREGLEYVTPELILLQMCEMPNFGYVLAECGANVPDLMSQLWEYLQAYTAGGGGEEGPELSAGGNMLIFMAQGSATSSGREEIGMSHLAHAFWQLDDSYALYYLRVQGIEEPDLLRGLISIEEEGDYVDTRAGGGEARPQEGGSSWKEFAPCLNETLKDNNPLIGREEELERTLQILCRKDKNNPLYIGEPGVGKTALAYGLVERIRRGEVPGQLAGSRVFELDLGGMVAGTQYRGDFEKRFKMVLGEIAREEKPIIYIDEMHNLSGTGAVGESSFDASNMLKPYLSDGHIRFIGATTFEEFKKYVEKNKGFVRRFGRVEVPEPSEEEAVAILKGLKQTYEDYHGVIYEEGVLEYAVEMSAKYIHERFLPDKAIDLMDEAGAYRKLHPLDQEVQTVGRDTVARVLTKVCRVPIETVKTDEIAGLATLEERLKKQIFGQDEAIAQVVNAVKFSKAGLLEEAKPLASLLFVGPTGVGKTELARSLAAEMGVRLVRFDMSEYEEKHAVAKLIGSPAGYVGYEEGGLLTEEIRKNPHCVLLLDEIEKAHADITNVLLSVMDYATLTDNQGRKADFRNVILIMTSNAGAHRIAKQGIGFGSIRFDDGVVMEEVKHTFSPEFRNRLNRIVAFHSMDRAMAGRVIDKKLAELSDMLLRRNVKLVVEDGAKEFILEKGISPEFGAREIDRVIRNEVKPLLVDELLFGTAKDGGSLRISLVDGKLAAEAQSKEQE